MQQNNDLDSSWQQPPAISGGMPFTLQMLSTGAGVGIGCGVGIGFISPINLSTVPVLGQAAQGISSSLAGLSSMLGPVGASTRTAARSLGVPGLEVGAGCGVLAGYYFGAGLMVKPSVVEGVGRATAQLAGRLTGMLQQQQQQSHSSALAPQHSSTQQLQQQQAAMLSSAAANTPLLPGGSTTGTAGRASSPVSLFQGMVPNEQQQQQTAASPVGSQPSSRHQQGVGQVAADPVVTRLLLQQQADIAVLKQQNRQLRDAVCRIDPKAAVCKGWKDRGSRRKGAQAEGEDGAAAGDVWSE